MELGALFAMMSLTPLQLWWCADSWVSKNRASQSFNTLAHSIVSRECNNFVDWSHCSYTFISVNCLLPPNLCLFSLSNCTHAWKIINYFTALTEVITNIFFGSGDASQQIHLDSVCCSSGQEQSLLECSHDPIGVTNCEHPEDVGIICQRSESE